MGEGLTRGASDIVKAESSGEDPGANGGLVSNLPHPRVNKTRQHTKMHIDDAFEDNLHAEETALHAHTCAQTRAVNAAKVVDNHHTDNFFK